MRWLVALGAILLVNVGGVARADSWMPPTRQTFLSPGKTARFTVIPREIASPLAYFNDKVKGREPAGQASGGERHARGIVERRTFSGWVTVWQGPLANEVSPVSALVSDDGAHVVTFDNWHSMGFGANAVVIYRADGSVVRSLKLEDFLPATYISALPRSVSSLEWHGTDRLAPNSQRVLVAVVIPAVGRAPLGPSATVEVAVDLTTGAVIPPAGPMWTRALASAAQVNAADAAYEAHRKSAFVAPLRAPSGTSEPEWHEYLREAFLRLDPDWKSRSASTTVLRTPGARDYAPSEGWVRDDLTRGWEDDVMMMAAPAAPERLAAIITDAARRLKPGSRRTVRVYVAVPEVQAAAIRAVLAPSGASVVRIDTATPIPQRPERLRGEVPDDLMNVAEDK